MSISDRPSVALIGNPNTGKSSLFNALCGGKARVGNYPGVTVEHKTGRLLPEGSSLRRQSSAPPEIDVVDLPGTYSLAARSADEAVSVDVLAGNMPGLARPNVVVVIVDATNLERNLYLFSQVIELGLPTILALNMWDRVSSSGLRIDTEALSQRLGVPVVCTCASKRTGIDELRRHIETAIVAGTGASNSETPSVDWARAAFPEPFQHEVDRLTQWLRDEGVLLAPFQVERLLIDACDAHSHRIIPKPLAKAWERHLEESQQRIAAAGIQGPLFETRARYGWVKRMTAGTIERSAVRHDSRSDSIDRWLTHRWIGLGFFLVLMFLIFQAITWFAQWPMEWIDHVQAAVGSGVESILSPGPLRSLLVDGVIAGVGSVIKFLPQIAILFLFIAILEDCGYMSRAAFVMDKFMSSVGMSGKSFLPLMSSFACAIPGIMATRTIDHRKDRMVTMLVAPLMSCSARLPVYVLMVYAIFPDEVRYASGWISLQGIIIFAMQSLGAIVAIPVAWLLKRFLFPGEPSTFIMELASYKWPSWRVLLARVWERVLSFVTRAGTLILVTSVLVWAAAYFPVDHSGLDRSVVELERLQASSDANTDRMAELRQSINQEKSRLIERSFLGRAGNAIEPLVKPLGWNGQIGIAVLASFPAREVIIATLGTIYALGSESDDDNRGLQAQMREAKWPDGRPVFTLASGLSIMVFFVLCAQCASTLLTIRRETNSWRWPIFSFGYMTLLAYVGAWLTYNVASMW